MNLNTQTVKYFPNISFCANDRQVKDADNKVIHRNTTRFFRDDIIWDDLAVFLEENFRNSKRVNVYSIGCSDGSEPYSLASSLRANTQNPEKFFPIQASDYDSEIIKTAQEGIYPITIRERTAMRRYVGDDYTRYFENDGPDYIKPAKKLKKDVNFKVANALDETKNAKYGDNVFLCRNFWPYLSAEDKNELIKNIKEKMNENSILVIGSFDNKGIKLDRLLSVSGFKNKEYTLDDSAAISADYYTVWKKR